MDETPVWNDMVSSTTVDKKGAKSICLKQLDMKNAWSLCA